MRYLPTTITLINQRVRNSSKRNYSTAPLLFGLILFVISSASQSQKSTIIDKKILTLPLVTHFKIVTPSWENWANTDGTGYYFDLVEALYYPEGISFSIDFQPYLRAKRSVRDKQADAMFAVYKQTKSPASMLTPNYPIDIGDTIIAFDASKTWNGIEDLNKQKIIIPRSYYDEYPLNIDTEKIGVNGSEAGFKMLMANRASYFITDHDEFIDLLKKYNVKKNQYRTEVLVTNNLYMAFSTTTKGQYLVDIFNRNMPKLIANGTIDKLYKKWGLAINDLEKD